jgi:uncharacterized membrane protein YphA (DoxX/SURF4 family)
VCASGRLPLQRLFSTFPSGGPGVGLLLLRAALGGIALLLGTPELTASTGRTPVVWIASSILLASGVGLIIGFMTPVASSVVGLCVLGILLSWIPAPPLTPMAAVPMVIIALAIGLLGPGAFSVDGHLFGRREIVIPPHSDEQ